MVGFHTQCHIVQCMQIYVATKFSKDFISLNNYVHTSYVYKDTCHAHTCGGFSS